MLRYFFKSLYNLGVLYEYFGTFCHIILVTLGSSCSNWAAIFSCPQKHILCTQKYYFIRNRGYLDKVLLYPQKHILCTQPKYCKEIQFRSETGRSFIRSGGKSKQWGNCSPPFFNQGEILPQNARTIA